MQIKKTVIDDFDYTDGESLEVDPDFPASVFIKIDQNDDSAEGVSYFNFTGLSEELSFLIELTKSKLTCEFSSPSL